VVGFAEVSLHGEGNADDVSLLDLVHVGFHDQLPVDV
jgi:hypothetical protein